MPRKTYIQTQKHQSLLDIAMQQYGTVESVYNIALANRCSVSRHPSINTSVYLPDGVVKSNAVLSVYVQHKATPATAGAPPCLGGIGCMEIDSTFILK